ncbi:uncharacterized protein BO80DRAFT_441453 [Aspergillus ibericus CBS 121593]|uniref:Uncharacterized protein n=1 Tax=Aspergillus ibericus CBS 121593 TaxID=1448316 RepID=A0A395HAA6_9EURO|nr:hypothetical protein BO80DRAFT_441453 [Aspergillus ibericus CBS 121593]RAL04576.1 hypothetical protein BO80DRAFT_441453 [Aspergillus ibericus CBS 121593]
MANLNLTLPATCPALHQGDDTNWSNASFALYTLVTLTPSDLDTLTTTLSHEWKQTTTSGATSLVRTPPLHNYAGQNLQAIVQAHIELDKEFVPREDGSQRGDLHWFPTAFLVVTSREWKERGLLFVYVDTGLENCPLERFWFAVDDAYGMLVGLRVGEVTPARCREFFDLEVKGEIGGERVGGKVGLS